MYSYEVPHKLRLAQCICAIVWCLFAGGPIFGFAALKPILVKEHVYESLCDVSSDPLGEESISDSYSSLTIQLLKGAFAIEEESNVAKCTAQDLKLNLMFTVGAVVTNVSALIIGRSLDIYGPKFCGLVGAFFLYFGCFIFIFAKQLEHTFIDPYILGYASMALGGPFSYISSFQLSNSFPKKSGTVLALLTGAFDASSAVFLIYSIIYKKSLGSFTIDRFFKLYLIVPIFITLAQLFIMPTESYKTDSDMCSNDAIEVHEEEAPLLAEQSSRPRRRDSIGDALKQPYVDEGEEVLIKQSGGIFGILHGYSAEYQIKTPWFYLMCAFATIQMLRLNYFVATINTQYTYLFHSVDKADKLNKFFDAALPLGGVISVPFVGLFLDTCSTITVLIVLLIVSILIGVLGIFGSFVAGILNVSLFVVYRPLFYTAVSDFCAKVFGFDTFGTVYGSIICISGVFNFGQSILDKLTHTKFDMNPTPINLVLVILTLIIGCGTISYVRKQAILYNKRHNGAHNA